MQWTNVSFILRLFYKGYFIQAHFGILLCLWWFFRLTEITLQFVSLDQTYRTVSDDINKLTSFMNYHFIVCTNIKARSNHHHHPASGLSTKHQFRVGRRRKENEVSGYIFSIIDFYWNEIWNNGIEIGYARYVLFPQHLLSPISKKSIEFVYMNDKVNIKIRQLFTTKLLRMRSFRFVFLNECLSNLW